MTSTATTTRFQDLAAIAGLCPTDHRRHQYEVRSNGLLGRYDVIGYTDDVRQAVEATKTLAPHAVPCETFTAHDALSQH